MEIIVGRESGAAEPRLCIKTGNVTKYLGAAGSVPKSVSRSHCVIVIDENNAIKINNVSDQNALFINGMEYKSKAVSESDLVELGPDRYRLDVKAVINAATATASKPSAANTPPAPKTYNISGLKKIWREYDKAKEDIQVRERKIGAFSAISGVITPISMTFALVMDNINIKYMSGFITAICAVSFLVIRVKRAADVPALQKKLDEKFQDNYVCPHCSHFMGNQRYELILRNGGCPWCKSKFTE